MHRCVGCPQQGLLQQPLQELEESVDFFVQAYDDEEAWQETILAHEMQESAKATEQADDDDETVQ